MQDDRFSDWWNVEKISVPFFDDQQLPVTLMGFLPEEDNTFLKEADEALSNFFQKGNHERLAISSLVYKQFESIKNEVDEPYWSQKLQNMKDPNEIWKFVQPMGISVERRPYGERDMYITISCDCEWEEEHGLQLVFRQGKKITRLSGIDGHLTDADAYDIPDEQDELLSKF